MRGLKKNQYSNLICQVVIGFIVWTNYPVEGACSKTAKKLWAYTNPATEHFTDSYKKFLSSDRGERCKWTITSSEQNSYIKLRFTNFQLKNSTDSDEGDCLEIYDGDNGQPLDELCNKMPKELYISSGGELEVIYKRGEVEGARQFSMMYSSQSALSKEKLIQIAGIVGAIIAGIGVTYFVLRITRCFRCLRKKSNSDDVSGNTERERDRLMQNTARGGANSENTPNTGIPQIQVSDSGPPQNNQNGVTTPDTNNTIGDHAHDSDIDSLQDMNELPPSYESLYLDELGESVTPPKYSPPPHIRTHPPRRVNTVN